MKYSDHVNLITYVAWYTKYFWMIIVEYNDIIIYKTRPKHIVMSI